MSPAKVKFNWVVNADRETPLSATTVKNYQTSLNKIAAHEYLFENGKTFHIDSIAMLMAYPEEVIKFVEALPNHNQKVQAFAAIMYELGIGKKADGTFAKLGRTTLKYYNAYQKTKLDKDGNPHSSQKTFDTYEEYLESYKSYSE